MKIMQNFRANHVQMQLTTKSYAIGQQSFWWCEPLFISALYVLSIIITAITGLCLALAYPGCAKLVD